ncbi:hypothetical protein QDR37_07650 [Amnibacterium sp. CER49]|uniref:hypothetical protein n=1 Tax=Amnibacterium sp. CER49 TaxID=3039161 RepID=UPI0024474863|nr:hypothetical protein [Amnibacterium sp. CER49]MDH2443812.1 hypothetical protein [Amnibacterium sp. CER49]
MPADDDLETPSVTDEVLGRRGVAAVFRAAYRGPHDAGDALFWLAHPAAAAPSGAPPPLAALLELRAGLYRPDPDGRARARYADLERRLREEREVARAALAEALPAAAEPEHGTAAAGHRARRRPLVLIGATVLAVGVVGAAAAVALPHAVARPVPSVSAHALQVRSGPAFQVEQLVAEAFRQPATSRTEEAGTELDALIEDRLGPGITARATVVGGASVDGTPEENPSSAPIVVSGRSPSGGTLDLVLILRHRSDWRWTVYAVPSAGGPPEAVAAVLGTSAGGLLQTARVVVPKGMVPSGLRLSTSTGTPFYWATYRRT